MALPHPGSKLFEVWVLRPLVQWPLRPLLYYIDETCALQVGLIVGGEVNRAARQPGGLGAEGGRAVEGMFSRQGPVVRFVGQAEVLQLEIATRLEISAGTGQYVGVDLLGGGRGHYS